MSTVYVNLTICEEERRRGLYRGQLYVLPAAPSSLRLRAFAAQMIEEAVQPLNPVRAQFNLPVEQFVSIIAPLKPQFIHHPTTRGLIRDVVREAGCDVEKTYIDVPRLRIVTHGGYLTSGVGYVHHPHRDTWYSAPMSQINWWVPIYDITSENSMAFHPRYWSQAVKNDSNEFNYYEWNRNGRANAASHIKSDTRKQPKPQEPIDLEPEIRVVSEPGGMLLFSAAQLHSTVPNTSGVTRYSIDFRTVHLDDVADERGAPNIDSRSSGTSLRDFVRASDFAPMPDEIALRFDRGCTPDGVLVFKPAAERSGA
jgi:hypothetical protein